MAVTLVPNSNLSGLPVVTSTHLKNGDPEVINRVFRLLATQIQKIQTSSPTPAQVTSTTIIQQVTGGGGGAGGGGGGGGTPEITSPTIQDTHNARLITYPATGETAGTFYYETDRTVFYLDYVATADLQVWQYLTGIMYAAFASRPTDLGQYDVGFLFQATDWLVTWEWNGTGWIYQSGTYSRTQSQLTALTALLGSGDAGLLVNVTDYAHVLEWNGSAFIWGPGELGSGYFSDFAVAPTGIGWHACDGSSGIHYLKKDGTTGTVTLPNTASSASYRKLGASYSATITAAATPTLAMNSYTPAGTISTPTFTGNASGSTNVLNTGGSTAVVPAPFTPAGTISTPTFSGTPATLTGTISIAGGDPIANFEAIQYFRQ